MEIAEQVRLEKALSTLQKSKKLFLSDIQGKTIKHERWRNVSSVKDYLFLEFDKQYATIKLTKNTSILVNREKKGDSIRIRMAFGKCKTRRMSLYIYDAQLLSMSPNYVVSREGGTWLNSEGEILVSQESLKKKMETQPDTLLYNFLLDPNIYWGLGETIVSEVLGREGYNSETKVSEANIDKIYPLIEKLLLQCFYLDGKGLNIDGEYGEFRRCLEIWGKKEYKGQPIEKKRVPIKNPSKGGRKHRTLYFVLKSN